MPPSFRRDILPWVQYHLALGVSRFYLLFDGTDTEALRLLRMLPMLGVTAVREPAATPQEAARYALYRRSSGSLSGGQGATGERLGAARVPLDPRRPNQPRWRPPPAGNFGLMDLQEFGLVRALELAREDRVDWLLHLGESPRSMCALV